VNSSSFTITDCGMLFFTDELMRSLLANSLETAELTPSGFRDVGKGPGSTEGEFIDWLTMKDNAAAVIEDRRRAALKVKEPCGNGPIRVVPTASRKSGGIGVPWRADQESHLGDHYWEVR